jgi:hypothetical protein
VTTKNVCFDAKLTVFISTKRKKKSKAEWNQIEFASRSLPGPSTNHWLFAKIYLHRLTRNTSSVFKIRFMKCFLFFLFSTGDGVNLYTVLCLFICLFSSIFFFIVTQWPRSMLLHRRHVGKLQFKTAPKRIAN